jgi:predicted nucleic acid-binding protein
MIAVDSSVLVELLSDSVHADAAEAALRDALARGPVVVCDVAVAEICAALQGGDQAMQALEDMGITFSAIERKAAVRAGEMQRRHRNREHGTRRAVPDFLVGAHALLQCNALITRDAQFFNDYFKGLKVIVPTAS